jgi:hypothetical protein
MSLPRFLLEPVTKAVFPVKRIDGSIIAPLRKRGWSMAEEAIAPNTLAIELMEGLQRTVRNAVDGLTDEQIYKQPSPDTNSIAWLAWHLSRWKDQFGAMIFAEKQVWVSQGWAEKFGMAAESNGQGDTLEQVAAFHPERTLLFDYAEAAHEVTIERIGRLTTEKLLEEYPYSPTGSQRKVWQGLSGTLSDFGQHAGQIAYLRGLITGYGWRGF